MNDGLILFLSLLWTLSFLAGAISMLVKLVDGRPLFQPAAFWILKNDNYALIPRIVISILFMIVSLPSYIVGLLFSLLVYAFYFCSFLFTWLLSKDKQSVDIKDFFEWSE